MSEQSHFLGLKWLDEKPYLVGHPDRHDEEVQKFELVSGKPLSIRIADDKYCVGDNGVCPYDRKIGSATKAKGSKCFVCGQSDFTQFMPIKGLREEQIETLKTQPHFNYINMFGPELLKVGVASYKNKRKRVLEQGSFATMYFGEGDGFTARQIEDLVSSVLTITQHVSWTVKFKLFNEGVDESKVKSILKATYSRINDVITDEYRGNLLTPPELVINYPRYRMNLPAFLPRLNIIDSYSVGDCMSGEIVGVFGLIIILKNGADYYAVNTKTMEGYIIEVGDQVSQIQIVTPGKAIEFKPKGNIGMELF